MRRLGLSIHHTADVLTESVLFCVEYQRNAKPKPIASSTTRAEYAYAYAWRCSALEEAEVEEEVPAAVVEVAMCDATLVVVVPFRRMALR